MSLFGGWNRLRKSLSNSFVPVKSRALSVYNNVSGSSFYFYLEVQSNEDTMHMITRSSVLFLWLHILTFVKSDDCTLSQFINGPLYDRNFDVSGLQSRYPLGKYVRVNCRTGYSAFFKLFCGEDGWSAIGNKCQPKSCGHPGDAAFADFTLDGEDFVFGAQVVYTCQKGYQMISRNSIRRCMDKGWDGVVPVCQAIKCRPIEADNNVQVFGEPDDAAYGNVIQFNCRFNSEVLYGSSKIECNEHGEWSDNVPKCKEVTCLKPEIENGNVEGNIEEYKQNEILEFNCNQLFKRTGERDSICIKIGQRAEWSPTPACELITCKLEHPTPGTKYDPPFSNVFRPGQSVLVTCGDYYYINRPQETSAVVTCKDTGEWSLRPQCNVVTCNPPDQYRNHLKNWMTRQVSRIRDVVSYQCVTGYRSQANQATCTRDGWRPHPFCEEITCDELLDIVNAVASGKTGKYHFKDTVTYQCKEGFRGQFSFTCEENGWVPDPNPQQRCEALTCNKKTVPHAEIVVNDKPIYNFGEEVEYVCKDGYTGRFSLLCGREWIGEMHCDACEKPLLEHGFVVGPLSNKLYFTCEEGYKLWTRSWWGQAKCGSVDMLPHCIDKYACGELPLIPNSRLQRTDVFWNDGEKIGITCEEDYTPTINQLTCERGQWNLIGISPKTICILGNNQCNLPPKVENAVVMSPPQQKYITGSEVIYKCRDQYTMVGSPTITCNNGHWEQRNISCTSQTLETP